jgi:hypothetical protein
MTDPQQDDLSHEADHLVQNTGNGWQPGDPEEQPEQTTQPDLDEQQ